MSICRGFFRILLMTFCMLGLSGSGAPSAGSEAKEREALQALLPADGEVSGLKSVSGPDFYVPRNLFDYMNGQADMYLEYGFSLLLSREYALDDGSPVTFEIYRMAGPLHAFGIYAAERTPEDRPVDMGVEGYLGDSVMGFWKGPYYIKFVCARIAPAAGAILEKAGRVISDKIGGSFSRPELFSVFPEDFRVKRSERFIPRNFLGQPYLKNGYRADYEKEGRTYQVFLLQEDSEEGARNAFQKYQNFLGSRREKVLPVHQGEYLLAHVEGEKNKTLFQVGPFWGGLLDGPEFREAEKVALTMIQRLRPRIP